MASNLFISVRQHIGLHIDAKFNIHRTMVRNLPPITISQHRQQSPDDHHYHLDSFFVRCSPRTDLFHCYSFQARIRHSIIVNMCTNTMERAVSGHLSDLPDGIHVLSALVLNGFHVYQNSSRALVWPYTRSVGINA